MFETKNTLPACAFWTHFDRLACFRSDWLECGTIDDPAFSANALKKAICRFGRKSSIFAVTVAAAEKVGLFIFNLKFFSVFCRTLVFRVFNRKESVVDLIAGFFLFLLKKLSAKLKQSELIQNQ